MVKHERREQWGSQAGFVLAALGSAVGLGNVWRFSYIVGENGGGAFLLLYLLIVLLMGLPILIAELTIGRRSQSDSVGAFQNIAPRTPWAASGYLVLFGAFIIVSYYAVISGWIAKYLIAYLSGGPATELAGGHAGYFERFVAEPFEPLLWAFGFLLVTATIVALGVKRGIEGANKILMPLLIVLLVGMAIFSLTLSGRDEGLAFLFKPDWSALKDPNVYLAALGQAFFSLSVGMGAMLTYGSYLPRTVKLPRVASMIAVSDTLIALIAGLVIFPAVFSFGVDPATGPALVFVVLPEIFAAMPGGTVLGLAFFALLGAAALSSAVSLLEVVVAYVIRRWQWSRPKATFTIAALVFLVGVPVSLGYGLFADLQLFGQSILDGLDFLASEIILPVVGLIFAAFVGWSWPRHVALRESGFGATFLGKTWLVMLRYLAPAIIILILLRSLGVL